MNVKRLVMTFRQTAARNKWFFAVLVLAAFFVLIWLFWERQTWWQMKESRAIYLVSLILAGLLVGWFLDTFTGNAAEKVEQMVAYAYLFPFICLGGMILPFLGFPNVVTLSGEKAIVDYPIGIVRGCSWPPMNPKNIQWVPDGIRCGNQSDQWLINVGGKVFPPTKSIAAEANSADANAKSAAGSSAVPKSPASPAPDKNTISTDNADQLLLEESSSKIEGGLVIPLYFVVIAIFGGAVSMMRRVPEYQARNHANATDHLSAERVREVLVFQIMQVFTAPLIAITAFYVVDPNSRAASIGLAFLAGFSSETVLIYIRAAVEKLRPETTRDLPKVEVTPSSLDFGKQAAGTQSAAQTVTLTNRMATVLSGSITASAEFICTPHGAFSVPSGSSLTISVIFAPTSAGAKNGNLEIKDGGPGSPRVVHLSGVGT